MTTCIVTGMACDCQPDEGVACTATPENVVKAMHGWRTACLKAEAELRAQSQPAPPVPADVQKIMRLMMPYVRACVSFNDAKRSGGGTTTHISATEADVSAAFKPLEAALTALVDDNHRLQFELDGVRAMRRPWSDLTDADRERAMNSMPNMLEGFMKTWGWLHFAKAIESICRDKNDHSIEPEQGEVK